MAQLSNHVMVIFIFVEIMLLVWMTIVYIFIKCLFSSIYFILLFFCDMTRSQLWY